MTTGYYKKNKEIIQKKADERCHNLSEEEKSESKNIVGNYIKISGKLKNKG